MKLKDYDKMVLIESVRDNNITEKGKDFFVEAVAKLVESIEEKGRITILTFIKDRYTKYDLEEVDGVYFLNRKLFDPTNKIDPYMSNRIILTDSQVEKLGDMTSVQKLRNLVNELEREMLWGI